MLRNPLYFPAARHIGACASIEEPHQVSCNPWFSRRARVSHKAQKTQRWHRRVRALSRKRFSVGDLPSQLQNSSSYVTASQSFQLCSSRGLTTSLNGIALEISEQARPPNHTPVPLAVSVSRRHSPARENRMASRLARRCHLTRCHERKLVANLLLHFQWSQPCVLYVKLALELWDAAFGGIEGAFGGKGGKICCLTVKHTVCIA
jgi:hypothetical protein